MHTAAATKFDTTLISALPYFTVSGLAKAAATAIPPIIARVDADCAAVFA
jgi:hypothetical protein